jgi:hypothetical protein
VSAAGHGDDLPTDPGRSRGTQEERCVGDSPVQHSDLAWRNPQRVVALLANLSNPSYESSRILDLKLDAIPQRNRAKKPPPKPRKPARPLSPGELRELAERYRTGETMQELGQHFKKDRKTISILLQKQGVPSRYRKMDDTTTSRCIELYNSGLSLVAVGQKLGIDQATVRRALLSRGVERRGQGRQGD